MLILGLEDGKQDFMNCRKDRLIYANDEYTFEVTLQCDYELSLLKTKNVNRLEMLFLDKPRIINYEWTEKFNYLSRNRMLICWNQNETSIFYTPTRTSHQTYKLFTFEKILKRNKVFESENKITCFEASVKHRLLLAGFYVGSIKLYKLDETKKYVGELKGHQK